MKFLKEIILDAKTLLLLQSTYIKTARALSWNLKQLMAVTMYRYGVEQ